MKIDSHQHFWKYNPEKHTWITEDLAVLKRDFLPEQLKPILKDAGFDGCVAVQAEQSEGETNFLLELAEQNSFIKGVVGWLDLRNANINERLEHYTIFDRLKGIRHIVQDEPDNEFLLRADFQRGIKALDSFNLTYDILVYTKQLPAVVKFVAKFENQPLVLDHLAKPKIGEGIIDDWKPFIEKIAKHENVFCKLSGMVTEASWNNWQQDDFKKYLDIVFESFGTKRLMVGSDWPVCLLSSSYNDTIGIIVDYIDKLSESEKSDIMGLNAIEFYNL